jgi:hypothetical protein
MRLHWRVFNQIFFCGQSKKKNLFDRKKKEEKKNGVQHVCLKDAQKKAL